MKRLLRLGLITLVVLNLAFVKLTGTVGTTWLACLLALTISSPWTARFRENQLWCALWNIGVLLTFAALVHDAIQSGPRQLLEDGMTLAAFCQVHLLNVLRNERRADLLFFNSFLIAVVTSFFCQDLAFSLVFAAWIATFVTTLSLAEISGDAAAWSVLRDAARRAAVVLLGTGLVFAFWPRDFRRPGLVDDSMFGSGLDAADSVGFSEIVDLRRSSHVAISERVALQATLTRGDQADVPRLWRGATLDTYNGRSWMTLPPAGRATSVDLLWERTSRDSWRSGSGTARAALRVHTDDPSTRRLFAPLGTLGLRVLTASDLDTSIPERDGTFVRLPIGRKPPAWELTIGDASPVERTPDRSAIAHWLSIDRDDTRVVPTVAFALLGEVTRSLPRDAEPGVVAERCRDLLASRFGYLAPGRQGAAGNLREFLSGEAPAHCEFFATGLAVLLRLHGVPCRIATGYLAHEWSPDGKSLVIRDSDAHAWVEVFDPDQGWYALDATPAFEDDDSGAGAWFDATIKWLADSWAAVTTFDAQQREALVDRLSNLPGATITALAENPVRGGGLALALAGVLAWLRRRRGDRAIADYERCLRRLRVARGSAETPRELLFRIANERRLDDARMRTLTDATTRHEQARFATVPPPRVVDRLRSRSEVPTC